MKVVQINATYGGGSTGKICAAISEQMLLQGIENTVLHAIPAKEAGENAVCYTTPEEIRLAALASRVSGSWGFEGKSATKKLIRELDRIQPDLIHLHNLHSHSCNLEMLFSWVRAHGTKVVWTFHDCWQFTGLCMHYDNAGCSAWETCCGQCPLKREYSFFFDKSRTNFLRKKEAIRGIDLTVVAPSEWMAKQARRSMFASCPIQVIYNGIDLNIFRRKESPFRKKYGLEEKKVILGVAALWTKKKGIETFRRLAPLLDPVYQIVLVGAADEKEKRGADRILYLDQISCREELAELYSAADVFVNLTREETLGLVNIEALACGTPVITTDVGGSPETVNENCGAVIGKDDLSALKTEIERICFQSPFPMRDCVEQSKRFDEKERYLDYIDLYRRVVSE